MFTETQIKKLRAAFVGSGQKVPADEKLNSAALAIARFVLLKELQKAKQETAKNAG